MSARGTYYAMKIIPCPCGSHEPYWHGPEGGLREYCCDRCWALAESEEPHSDADVGL